MKKYLMATGLTVSLLFGTSPWIGASSAMASSGEVVKYHKEYKTPTYIGTKWEAPRDLSNNEIVWGFLNAKKGLFQIKGDAKSEFQIVKRQKDSLGMTHYRLQEVYQGIPVYGSTQTIHVNREGDVNSYFGQVVPNLENYKIQTKAKLTVNSAIQIMKNDLEKQVGTIKNFAGKPTAELIIYPHNKKFYLAYFVKASLVSPQPGYWKYFIDATTGNVIEKYNQASEATGSGTGVLGDSKTFETTYSGGKYYLWGTGTGVTIKTYNANHISPNSPNLPGSLVYSTNNYFSDGAAVDAQVYAQKVVDYYKNTFGRNSYDDQGAPVISSVHVGRGWNNAAWIGTQMVYGDGDGTTFIPLSGALDVVGHELTHAVDEYTANLDYQDESGALNESISDIFGAMIDSRNWLMGEDVYTPGTPGDALRSLADPTLYGQPDHYSKYVHTSADNGGVHTNSGINNKAAYLMAQGGTHYGVTVTGIGRNKTAQIYYRALEYYMNSSTDFSGMRQAAIQAATDLYGASSQEVKTVKDAYTAVGIN